MLRAAKNCSGEALIHDAYFEAFARVEACEVFMIVDTIADFVDWEKWADYLRQDYKDVGPRGVTYWCRS